MFKFSTKMLKRYVDIAIESELLINDIERKLVKLPSGLYKYLSKVLSELKCEDYFNTEYYYDFKIVEKDILEQRRRLSNIITRRSSNFKTKIEAYSDIDVAVYSETTKNGTKTRNRFYAYEPVPNTP